MRARRCTGHVYFLKARLSAFNQAFSTARFVSFLTCHKYQRSLSPNWRKLPSQALICRKNKPKDKEIACVALVSRSDCPLENTDAWTGILDAVTRTGDVVGMKMGMFGRDVCDAYCRVEGLDVGEMRRLFGGGAALVVAVEGVDVCGKLRRVIDEEHGKFVYLSGGLGAERQVPLFFEGLYGGFGIERRSGGKSPVRK
jgi:hypothetical protein